MKICNVAGCGRPHKARGFCSSHYGSRRSQSGFTKTCSLDGCFESHKAKGFCIKHYERFQKYGDPIAGGVFQARGVTCCTVEGCNNKPAGRGLCGKHYYRWSKYGDPKIVKWEYGARERTEWHTAGLSGYVWRYDPTDKQATANGFVYQHRFVMSEMIGRALFANETVHHKNGNRADNRPENLELWAKSQPAGQRVKDLLEWAKTIIAQYDGTFVPD